MLTNLERYENNLKHHLKSFRSSIRAERITLKQPDNQIQSNADALGAVNSFPIHALLSRKNYYLPGTKKSATACGAVR